MITSHFHMKLAHSSIERNISVLFVHVVDSCSRLISENDAKSFNVIGSFFVNFVDGQDLSLSGFGFQLSSEMIPVFRFSDNFIGSKESNGIDFRVGILFGG